MRRPINKGLTSQGSQRYRCLNCQQTFTDSFETIYYRRQVTQEEVRIVLQSHCEGTSLRGISRTRTILQLLSELDSSCQSKSPTHFIMPKYKLLTQMPLLPTLRWSFVEKNTSSLLS